MRPGVLIIGGVIAVVAILIVGLAFSGMLPFNLNPFGTPDDAPPGATNCDYADIEIYNAMVYITGQTLQYDVIKAAIRNLDIQMCSSDGQSLDQIEQYYRDLYSDWVFIGKTTKTSSGWEARMLAWRDSNATYARNVLFGSGASVTEVYGHDAMVMTGHGTYQAYVDFFTYLSWAMS